MFHVDGTECRACGHLMVHFTTVNTLVFCHVTLHLWGRIFKRFPDLRGLSFADDGNIIGRLSQALRLIAASKPVFKLDGNLDFNVGKTMFLAKGTTARHVYERAHFFLQNDPSLQDIAHDFTLNMFSVQAQTPTSRNTWRRIVSS